MAIGKIRAGIIIILFATSAAIPVLMETAIVPLMNILNFIENFADVEYDENGNPIELNIKYESLINSIQEIRCLTDESDINQTVIQIKLNVSNTDPFRFDLLIPGIDMTIFWKAGLPYAREKETVLGWKDAAINDSTPHKEPIYDARRWTRVMGIKMDPLRVGYGQQDKYLYIKLILYNDEVTPGMSNALGQMIGTVLRTQSTKDPNTDETLMYISGSASLDIPGFSFPLGLNLGLDLSGFLNFTQLLGGIGEEEVTGGTGESGPSLFELIFQPGGALNIFDVQNYNDSNGNFERDYSGIDNQTGLKIWTEELYQHGAISAYIYMDLIDKLGMNGLNLTLLKSSHNPDNADVNETWDPKLGGFEIGKEETINQIFLYLPDSSSLSNQDWANKIFGLFGFTSDQNLHDLPTTIGDFGDGRIIAGGTMRLTGDLRENSSFAVGDGLGALITQAIGGVLPIGVFGSIDLKLNDMPLSICLDLPLEVNLSSFLSGMGGEEPSGGEESSAGMFGMLMDYLGFNSLIINGLAVDTFNTILQLNMTTDLDMFLPYGIYMPDNVTYDTNGEAIPYLGIAGGPIQIYDASVPEEYNGQRFAVEATESAVITDATHLTLSRGNVTEIVRVFGLNGTNIHEWWDSAHVEKNFTESGLIYVNTLLTDDNFTLSDWTDIIVDYKYAIWKDPWYAEHLIMNISSLDSPTLKESMAQLMATIGRSRQGDGISYLFKDQFGKVGHLKDYLDDYGQLPNPDDNAAQISITEDQFKIDVAEIVPDFGNGIITLAKNMGIDPLFIEYLNNSIPHNNTKTILEDILSIRQLLNILRQPGPQNDIYDYLVDANKTYLENATVIDNNSLLVSHDTLKYINSISWNDTEIWNVSQANVLANGLIFLNNNLTGKSFTDYPYIEVEYIASKLDLLDLSNLFGAILNLTVGSGDTSGGGGGGGDTSDLFADIFSYLPGTLDALGIDFDRIMPDLISYLRWNISQPEPKGYGIKFFEMLDIGYHALMDVDTGSGDATEDLLGGSSRDLIDQIIKEVTGKFIEQADPFQLAHAAFNDLTPLLDYLNRSGIFSREVLIPLVVGLFPSGTELSVIGGESVSIEEIVNIILPLIMEMLMGGDLAAFDHEALNPFAWLTAPEAIEYHSPIDYNTIVSQGKPVYQVGDYNWTADYPNYENLRLMSSLFLGLLQSGFGAAEIWDIINQLGLIDLGEGDGTGGDPFAGLKGLLSLIGSFVPATEWDSLLRELGVWSTWEGEFDQFDITVTPYIFGIPISITIDALQFVSGLINLEQLLATGSLGGPLGGEFVQLCLYENQSYGNPYSYLPGYDTSYNTGPYRDYIGVAPAGPTDNWGWAPVGWDPGGFEFGSAGNNYNPDGAKDYKKSFLSRLISTVPVELDVNVLAMDPMSFTFGISFPVLWFTIPIDIDIALDFDPELFMRIRLEGNPPAMMGLFEEEGIPLFGLAAHFVGGDLVGLVTDLIDSLTNPTGGAGGAASNETFEFPELDMVVLLQSFLNADLEILHYWKYLVDPEFMKASEWYLDPGFVDINATYPTLIWDNDPNIPGDGDGIPDEFPWYRFTIPIYNQINPDLGPFTTAGREPPLLDYLTPIGPPGSGLWREDPDGIADGLQHYWYDTPYAYVNTTVDITDPWLWITPAAWNNMPPGGEYVYTVPGVGSVTWGDDPGEQVPLLQTAPGVGISDEYWDWTGIPTLYYVPSGTSPGVVGSANYYPIAQPSGTGADRYPNIWNSFNITLNQTDYRFGYWTTQYDEVLGKNYTYLETKPFYDILSYAFYPQLMDLLDWIAPLIVDLIESLIMPSSGGGGGGYDGSFGFDYYIQQNYDDVYSKFDIDALQPLGIFSLLQWIWDGAGTRWNGSQAVPYIEPYTIPDLQGALDWLADHGFTIDFLIRNLDKIFDMLAMEEESGGPSTGAVDLGGDLAGIFSVEALTNVIDSIEDYFRIIVAQNPNGTPNRTKATLLALDMLKDMTEILDIYPIKAMRGALNYLMPRLFASDGGGSGGGSSSLDVNELDLGTFLEQSGIMDIIFENVSKLSDISLTLAIHKSSIDLYLFGQLIEDVPLDIEFELDLASLMGDAETDNESAGGDSGGTDMLNNLPISFGPTGFPYIELSTFNGPFDIGFKLFNTSLMGGQTPVANTNVTIGEIWYDEVNGVYIFNRTQSSYEFENGLWGWTDPDAFGINRTYVRPNSLLRSDGTGMVYYSSVIEEDGFGWVDPYIYIHVEKPNEFSEDFYWWNVTGHPVQKTLAGNTPPYKARWIEDGSDLSVQSTNTLPASCINIDGDPYWEIFARVEIDGYHMPDHEVVYVETGNVSDVNALASGGGTTVRINSSQTTSTQTWNIFSYVDQTKYIVEEEITPTGKTVSYPTITEVISGFHLRANNWNDDSIYNLRIDYVNLTGHLENYIDIKLDTVVGSDSGTSTYNGAATYIDGAFTWTRAAGDKSVSLVFSPTSPAPVDYRYGIIDIDASDFINKTIQSVTIDVNVDLLPEPGGSDTATRLYEDTLILKPATTRTYFFTEDFASSSVTIQGNVNLNTKDATEAWFNYTTTIPDNQFLNGIDWNLKANEWLGGTSTSQIAEVIIEYYNASDSTWYTLFSDTPGTRTYTPADAAYVSPPYLDDWADLTGVLRNPTTGVPLSPFEDLYLTSRGYNYTYSTGFETVTQVKFAARYTESPSISNDGIGWTNDTRNYNTSASVTFRFYPFIDSWGIDTVEIPEGFVDDFVVTIVLYDPLSNLDLPQGVYPTVTVSYNRLGPMITSASEDVTSIFASKYIVYLEAWDSLVRGNGDHGDILFKDNITAPVRLEPLTYTPNISTWIEVIDLEAQMYINVTIDAGQTLRNYYLKMNITPGLGYEGRGYTGDYRFSIGSDNPDALRKIGAYPAKKVLATSIYGFPISMQIGIADLEAFPSQFTLWYILTFEVSPEFMLNATAQERFHFSAVWEKAQGSYEIISDKNEIPQDPYKPFIDVQYI